MIDHLISATLFAVVASIVAILLRNQRAHWRHAILLAAVLRFAIPTPVLTATGAKLASLLRAPKPTNDAIGDITRLLFRGTSSSIPLVHSTSSSVNVALGSIWAAGTILIFATWLRQSCRRTFASRCMNAAEISAFETSRAALLTLPEVEVQICSSIDSPAVQGLFQHRLLIPEGVSECLEPAELRAIFMHEFAHIARRDNFSAAVVRLLVSLFWFHPLLWWIEWRMLLERERACDEIVLHSNVQPDQYIASILKICHIAVAGRPGFAYATGSNLKSRMEQIMSIRNVSFSSPMPRFIFWALIATALLLPVGSAVLTAQNTPGSTVSNAERSKLLRLEVTRSSLGSPTVSSGTEHRTALDHINQLIEVVSFKPQPEASVYDRWLHEEVAYLITRDEAAAFKALSTDAERDQFIKQFWERRASMIGSTENPSREENYRRLAYANSHYGTAETRGTDSARGRLYIVLGPPDEIDSHPVDGFESWVYRNFDQSTDNLTATFLIPRSPQTR